MTISSSKQNYSFLNDDKLFKAKTRLQKRKFGAEGYKLMDVKLLEKLLSNSCICKICNKKMGKMEILEDTVARKDLCEKLIFRCRNCGIEMKTFTSNITGSQISHLMLTLERPMPPFHLVEKVLPNFVAPWTYHHRSIVNRIRKC